MHLGSVQHLYRYPTKGLAGEELPAVTVVADGFENDRVRALHVTTVDHPRYGQAYRGKEDNALHLLRELDEALALGARRGVALAPAEGGRHFDARPISIIFDTWLTQAEALCNVALEPLRFRPNIVVRADNAFSGLESDLLGAVLRFGDVQLEVVDPIRRCVTPTYDLHTGESNPSILRTLAQERENVMGVYCTVAVPGRIVLGTACICV